MKRTKFTYLICLAILTASCSKSVMTSSIKLDKSEVSTPDNIVAEKPPQIVKSVLPIYPEIARKAGLEGNVWVKIGVDKYGTIREVIITSSSDPIFNQPAVDAARQLEFIPAISEGKPIDAWVSLPFHFRLK